MEKKKITLDALKVSSFVTPLNNEELVTIKGGYKTLIEKRKLLDLHKWLITSSDVRGNFGTTGKRKG